jgi:crotonobetainyl-CoA:carnitine CoA-transferase CaiB-like acyl-CoA transferase
VTLTIQTEAQWKRLCQALGQPELANDARFAALEARRVHHDELDRLITAWTRERSAREAMEQLQACGVPAGMVCTAADLRQDPQLAARRYFQEGIDPDGHWMMGFPFQLSRGRGKVRWRGPAVGQHNEAVICGKLGRPTAELAAIQVDRIGTSYDIE